MLCVCGFGAVAASCTPASQTKDEPFRYTVDEFADVQVLRYRIPGWDSLSLNQKAYIYHLGEAGKSGRDILFSQNFKYNIRIRKILENIIENYTGDKHCQEWNDFLVYAKRVFFSNGIHHHYAEDKILPTCPKEYFQQLMEATGTGSQAKDIIPIVFDPNLYPQRKYTGSTADVVEASSVNFYGNNITKDEVNAFYGKMEKEGGERPLAYGINTRLVKEDGKLVEQVYKIGGRYSNSISVIIGHLAKAAEYAENDAQKEYIAKLIEYYKTGDLKTWDEYNVLWVQENQG
jgi:dipeptidyl-peptidase-3